MLIFHGSLHLMTMKWIITRLGIFRKIQKNNQLKDFLERRAVAFQAYYEHMPLRRTSLPNRSDIQLYRRLSFGNLVEFNVLDTTSVPR